MNRRQRESHTPRERQGERGAAMAVSVIGMLTLILATGLAIDISHFYTAKAELQSAADAAALAGASQLNSTTGGIKLAVTEATKAMNKYDFKKTITLTSANVTFASNINGTYVDAATAQGAPTTVRFVKVTIVPQPVGVTFSAMVIGNTKNVGATATAGLSVGLTMNKFYTAFTFVESASAPLVRDGVYSLAPKNWNDNSPTSYRVLTLPGGTAGSDLVVTGPIHAYGYTTGGYEVAHVNATSPAATPNSPSMCRSAKIGINTRFGDYTVHPNVNATDEPPDLITQEGITFSQYNDKLADPSVTKTTGGIKNRRVITLPIVNNSGTNYNTTTGDVTANRLGAFFIRRKIGTTCAFEVEYIGDPLAVPVGTYTPGSVQSSELSIPVLYR
ncbi:MAG: pilus assembly protein TadG-related protein [Pyrinomonadaceae bacterium]